MKRPLILVCCLTIVIFFQSNKSTLAQMSSRIESTYYDTIYQVQKTLKKLGYNPGPLDGKWGKRTEKALKEFQHENRSPVSGEMDSTSLNRLKEKSQELTLVGADSLDVSLIENLLSKGQYTEAILRLKDILVHEPNNAEAHFLLAKARCLNAVELKGKYPGYNLGGFPSKICEELEIYLDLAPNGSYSQKARSVYKIISCDLRHIWQAIDAWSFIRKGRWEIAVTAELKKFKW